VLIQTLETERLILRKWKEEDLEDFYAYAKNPIVGPRAGWQPHKDRATSFKILKTFIAGEEVWAIVCKKENKVIGSIGLHRDMKRMNDLARMVGYVLREESWGEGLMPEAVKRVLAYAFLEVRLDLVSVYHYPFNEASRKVIMKCGFEYEGTLKAAHSHYNGEIYDELCYAITKEAYTNR
jgi:putative acetyltransferase